MTDKKQNTRRKAHRNHDSDSQDLFVPTKKHDQYQRWSEEEHARYVAYLEQHLANFTIQKGKKRKNLFIRMAEDIQCQKNNEQCRTHHEKMLKKYRSIENIIRSLKEHESKNNVEPHEAKIEANQSIKNHLAESSAVIFSRPDEKLIPDNIRQKNKNKFMEKPPKNPKIDPQHKACKAQVIEMPNHSDNSQDSGDSKCSLENLDIPIDIRTDRTDEYNFMPPMQLVMTPDINGSLTPLYFPFDISPGLLTPPIHFFRSPSFH